MIDAVSCLMRAATRKPGDRLKIVTGITHERFQAYLKDVNADFFLLSGLPGFKGRWESQYSPVPANHVILKPCEGQIDLPPDLIPDLIVAQHRFGQYQAFKPLADRLHVPLLTIEHTLPRPEWTPLDWQGIHQARGDVDAFITEENRDAWGWDKDAAIVVPHGVDTDLFRPGEGPRHTAVVTVANDYRNRGDILGFDLWVEATRGMEVRPLGDTPGLSQAPPSVEALAAELRSASIFLCTARSSPVPMSLLEAMSAGLAPVCFSQSMVAAVIEDGVNGFLVEDAVGMRARLKQLKADRNLRDRLGRKARETVLERFPLERFVRRWEEVFRSAASKIHHC